MVTVSHVVQKLVNEKVFLQEAMNNGIISYGSLAKQLKQEIEEELGKEVKHHAIVMALRRYEEKIKEVHKPIVFDYSSELILKTEICDISVRRSPTLFEKLKKLYDIVNFENGDLLNIIHGRCEVSVVTNERYKEKTLNFLKDEKIINVEKNLVCLTLTFPQDYFRTPGVIFNIVRNLAWENINIFEIISTNTELTFIISKDDAIKGYKTLEKMVRSAGKKPLS
jgi:aspartokinase